MSRTEIATRADVIKKPQRKGVTRVLIFSAMLSESNKLFTPKALKRKDENGKGLMRLNTEKAILTTAKTNENREKGMNNRFMIQK